MLSATACESSGSSRWKRCRIGTATYGSGQHRKGFWGRPAQLARAAGDQQGPAAVVRRIQERATRRAGRPETGQASRAAPAGRPAPGWPAAPARRNSLRRRPSARRSRPRRPQRPPQQAPANRPGAPVVRPAPMAPRPAAKAAAAAAAPECAAARRRAAPRRAGTRAGRRLSRPTSAPTRSARRSRVPLASLRAVTPTQPPADPRNDQFAERLRVQREAAERLAKQRMQQARSHALERKQPSPPPQQPLQPKAEGGPKFTFAKEEIVQAQREAEPRTAARPGSAPARQAMAISRRPSPMAGFRRPPIRAAPTSRKATHRTIARPASTAPRCRSGATGRGTLARAAARSAARRRRDGATGASPRRQDVTWRARADDRAPIPKTTWMMCSTRRTIVRRAADGRGRRTIRPPTRTMRTSSRTKRTSAAAAGRWSCCWRWWPWR